LSQLPADLAANPRLDRWIAVGADGVITIRSGKVELGQGIITAIAAIAAHQLGVSPDRLRAAAADTRHAPDEGQTSGSQSIEQGGAAMRHAAALVRTLFAQAAAEALGVPAETLTVEEGLFSAPGRNERRSYADLAARVDLAQDASILPAPLLRGGAPAQDGLVRHDLPGKLLNGGYIHDIDLPGMLHGRMLRPHRPGARLIEMNRDAILALHGVVAVLRDGSVAGLVACREDDARRAADAAQAHLRWDIPPPLPPMTQAHDWMDALPAQTRTILEEAAEADCTTHRALYARPYIAHASIGPCCAVAAWQDGRLTVWTHSQGIFPLRGNLAQALRVGPGQIDVIHAPGAGCYGHNGADDVALDAALLARAAGAPVMCQWSRADELSAAPFGAAMRVALAARLDGQRIVSWSHEVHSPSHGMRPSTNGNALLAAWSLAEPCAPPIPRHAAFPPGAGERNAVPLYRVGARRIVHHLLPQGPLRSSALRSLGAHCNVFAIESFMDELAEIAGVDPVRFRLDHLDDKRDRAVIEAVARLANWQEDAPGGEGIGRGIGFARYKNSSSWCAVVAEVEATDAVRLRRAWVAVDCGTPVHEDGVRNQVEGGLIQAASWTLKEAAGWTNAGPLARSWQDYPILRFAETPGVEIVLVHPEGAPSLGAGECVAGPTAAAIGNALRHALGVRVRRMPITPEQIAAAVNAMEA
jgi:nicotinate dehydrogenase subunit B